MRKRWIILIVICAPVAGGIIWWELARKPEPSYAGRSLSSWVWDLGPNIGDNPDQKVRSPESYKQAEEAIGKMGTNAIPHLIASGHGVIVIMSSAAGRFGYPNRSPYSTAKWGLIGFMKTLSMELGVHNIRANAILPGAVEGERIQKVFQGRADATRRSVEEIKAEAMSNQSLQYLVDPKDIAALAVFLASDAAKSISGQIMPIDGDMQRN